MSVEAGFELTSPEGQTFYALVTDALDVWSNRGGDWAQDSTLNAADLVMPEQDLNDWDVAEIEPSKLPSYPKELDADQMEKANPYHRPPGNKHGGEFTTAGDGGIRDYLDMVVSVHKGQPSVDGFIREHGKIYKTDSASYQGGPAHECYKNAALAALGDDDLTYVEGYVSVHGVPIHHAWTIDKSGVVRDPTLKDGKGIQGYFGVPIKTDYLSKTLLKKKLYGVLTHDNAKSILAAKPLDVVKGFRRRVKSDADQQSR